jgi:eukaryotic-like serine/threonine-protein kinase
MECQSAVISYRWQEIERIVSRALSFEGNRRIDYVHEACGQNAALRAEVESLLTHADNPLLHSKQPAWVGFAGTPWAETRPSAGIAPGARAGPYLITESIGAGGMGHVFRAVDERLNRVVAIKTIAADLFPGVEQRHRLLREAQAISKLNHPNLVALHDVLDHEGELLLVMEYVDGRPLSSAIGDGLDLWTALDYSIQLADALAAAHFAGIVHRDVKPANIMLTAAGTLKLLDFGLAKLLAGDDRNSGGVTLTRTGVVLGTPAYMSPEQAAGTAVDIRTDIFAFGCVLYEMVTGAKAFAGQSPAELISAVQRAEPRPVTYFGRSVPPALEQIIRLCMKKCADRRPRHIDDVRLQLLAVREDLDSGRLAWSPVPVWIRHAGFALLGGIALLIAGVWYAKSPSWPRPSGAPAHFEQLTYMQGPEVSPNLSPDGTLLVYSAYTNGNWDIFLQRTRGSKAINLTADSAADDRQPTFSPDGESIAFRSERDGGGIFIMGATGESVRKIASDGFSPSWSPDGRTVVCSTVDVIEPEVRLAFGRLLLIDLQTGYVRPHPSVIPDAVQPRFSPHSDWIAYAGRASPDAKTMDIFAVKSGGGNALNLTADRVVEWSPAWAADGRSIYFSSRRTGTMGLWQVPFERGVTAPVTPRPLATPSTYSSHLSFSRDGKRAVYVKQDNGIQIRRAVLAHDGHSAALASSPVIRASQPFCNPALDRSGKFVTFHTIGNKEDLFVSRIDGTGLRQLTDDEWRDRMPQWSPDGKWIAFYSNRHGDPYQVWVIRPDGSDLHQLTFQSGGASYPVWSPDGSRIIYNLPVGSAPSSSLGVIRAEISWQAQKPETFYFPTGDLHFIPYEWSRSDEVTGYLTDRAGEDAGIATVSLSTGQFRRLSQKGSSPQRLGRGILFVRTGELRLLDPVSGVDSLILSVRPHEISEWRVGLLADQKSIFFGLRTVESDIWMMNRD